MIKLIYKSILLGILMFFWSVGLLAQHSGTLPVVYINVEGGKPITSKTEYIDANIYIDALNIEGFESLGSANAPYEIQIRGRGNHTWWDAGLIKKPYKIKFSKKTTVLGLSKNKHFALLAHADDNTGFLRNTLGFECSRLLDFRFTPSQVPVEVYLNGEYVGIYFLTETIRVDKGRLNIPEQEDNSIDPDNSWLVEIDNYASGTQQIKISLDGTNLHAFNVTYHSPELLSQEQESFLIEQFETFKKILFSVNKNTNQLEEFVDLESLAKYYIIAELLDHIEAFLGSCYMYRERGERWHFGPVWDFGQAFNSHHEKNEFIYAGNTKFPHSIIEQIAEYPCFQENVKKWWSYFYAEKYQELFPFIDSFVAKISKASESDYARWPAYGVDNIYIRANDIKQMLKTKSDFLNSCWGETSTLKPSVDSDETFVQISEYDLNGRKLINSIGRKLVIERKLDTKGGLVVKKNIKGNY